MSALKSILAHPRLGASAVGSLNDQVLVDLDAWIAECSLRCEDTFDFYCPVDIHAGYLLVPDQPSVPVDKIILDFEIDISQISSIYIRYNGDERTFLRVSDGVVHLSADASNQLFLFKPKLTLRSVSWLGGSETERMLVEMDERRGARMGASEQDANQIATRLIALGISDRGGWIPRERRSVEEHMPDPVEHNLHP